jgi:hypothetical protein
MSNLKSAAPSEGTIVDDDIIVDVDDTDGGDSTSLAERDGGEDADIDEGAFTDEPDALALMVEDDLEESVLAQPADPFDRIAVGKLEKPFHGELPPVRDDDDL